VRRAKARSFSGCKSRPATIAPAGSNRSSRGGDEAAEAFDGKGRVSDPASTQTVTTVNAEQTSKQADAEADLTLTQGRLPWVGKRAKHAPIRSAGAGATGCVEEDD